MRTLMGNLRYSLRMLRKNPGLTAAVIATLMLGIGATTAIYTVVYAVLIAPLPYPDPEQLVMVWSKVNGHDNGISAGDFLDWKAQSTSFQQMAAWTGGSFNLSTSAQPEQIEGMRPTPGWFSMQGIPFLMGRDFVPEEGIPGKDHSVILTYKLWNRLGADRNVIGQSMRINSEPYTVVGVLAPGIGDRFDFQLATPLAFRPEQINHDYHWLIAMGRLKKGVSRQQAQADMDAVTSHIAAAYPNSNKGWGASVEQLKNDFLPPERIHNLWLLLGAVGFVLVIACVNIANLLLAKGAARQREVAIRSSVGANRQQIFIQFLTESVLLALLGGGLGIAMGAGLLRAILTIVPPGILPSEADFRLDIHVLVAALASTTLAGILFGCAPAWYASRVDPAAMSKTIAAAVHSVDPEIALARVRTLDQVKTESLGEDRYTMVLFASFALVALLLAAVGIYGLMAFAVAQRTNEIGLRLALGASRGNVIWLILHQASLLAAVGLAVGFGGAVLVGRTMRSTLYGVGVIDAWVIVVVGVILFVTALCASYLPARRAARIDPMQALRTD